MKENSRRTNPRKTRERKLSVKQMLAIGARIKSVARKPVANHAELLYDEWAFRNKFSS
jgi:hypothetical protein